MPIASEPDPVVAPVEAPGDPNGMLAISLMIVVIVLLGLLVIAIAMSL